MTNHAQEAKRLISATDTKDWNDPSPYVDRRIAAAQVHATLALAEQQRIANLIALLDQDSDDAFWALHHEDGQLVRFRPEIASALGIGDTK